ncbi:MAG: hypothetical protein KIG73_04130, partial [Alphaproteobacteria bacterium]|nr:hypothetical protein [Alphaproteobacteria bacterium]
GVIYDTGAKTTINTYFFQPDDNAIRRPGVPVSDLTLGADKMRERLIAKYITEYFYVTPDMSDVTRRREGRTSLRRMSLRDVFNTWLQKVAPEIEDLAKNRALRTVSLISVAPDINNKYWIVNYELRTWRAPNNFASAPDVTRGTIYLGINYAPGMRDTVGKQSVEDYLESGGDPAAVFKFVVIDVASHG